MRFYKTTISLLLFLISIHIHAIDKEDVFFNQITVDDGLSNNSAICFNQDTSGLIWIGTNDGLNMYNSAEFRIFRHNIDDSTTLSNNRIKSIDFDPDKNLWVGTEEGLNLFVSDIFQFKRFYCDTAEKKELLTNNINIVFPYNEKVFLGTDRGIKVLEKGKNSFTHYHVEGLEKDGIKNVTVIKEDSRNNLLVGTESGLFYYNQDFELIATFPEIDRVAWGNTIVEDDRKNIWVCTANGVYKITNINTGSYKLYHSGNELSASKNISFSGGAKDDNSNLWLASGAGLHMVDDQEHWTLYTTGRAYGKLNDNYIRSVFFDKEGNMWVGTDAGGINLYYKYRKKFKYLTVYQEEGKRLLSNKTKGIYADKNGFIWIGAEGLNRYNPETGRVKYWKDINKIISITEDKSSNIWVATEKGVYRINQNREIVKHYEMNSRVPGANYIHDLHITSEGHLLAATWGGGLWILKSPDTGFQPITHTGKHNGLDRVKYIYEDRDKQLWLGNDIGIFKLNKKYKPVFSISNNNEKPESLNGSYTYCMYQDIEGNYWVGTNRGLQCYNPEKKTISNFGRKNGFRNEVILGILEDKENNLWLTTYSGLIKFNRLDSTVRVFTSKDGLISNQFSQGSVATSPVNQNLYLGSLGGVVFFDPLQLEKNANPPDIVFTDFYIYNESIKPEAGSPLLTKHISQTKEIILPYKYSVFGFQYVAINYGASEALKYSYKLEGFDKDWREVGSNRTATYTNLKPGHYSFRVGASNEDGVMSEKHAIMKIQILFPWWLKWYTILIYALILFSALFLARNIIIARQKLRHKVKIQELEHEQENKINDLKIQFFTNVSHEFRTPLTLISGPLECLLYSNHLRQEDYKQLNIINRNLNRLLNLINQLLEFRKIEKKKIKLRASKNDLIPFVKDIISNFEDIALEKGIKINFNSSNESLFVYIDPVKIETVLYNILINAIKFNSFKGEIDIKIEKCYENQKDKVRVSITDHGIGIPEEEKDKVFERFYQASRSNILGGTGIGLALSKEFAELHGGTLSLESEENVYTTFTLTLLRGKIHLEPSQIVEEPINLDNYKFQQPFMDVEQSIKFKSNNLKKEHTIALVEDNHEVRSYISNLLSFDYNILEYRNGNEAYEDILIEIPDLIITDIMMPKMNGTELCRKIKNELRTCHIPVIMLTAKDMKESQIKGIETGADAYITKPFSNLFLKATIKNLITSRKKMEYRYSVDTSDKNIRQTTLSNDEIFLKRFYAYLDKNISNPELDINSIIDHFNISRLQLYRKLKSQTNLSANKIIKNYRLQKAKELILAGQMNISEIAYSVGFSDSLYFSKCFKQKFKVSPSHYLKKKSESGK